MQDPAAPLITIVTVTFDDLEGLRRTLASLRAQTVSRSVFECVVVDGAGSAATVLAEFDDVVDRVIAEPDEGPYDGMNKGWRLGRGRFVQFLNGGDELHDDGALAALEPVLTGLSEDDWVVTGALHLHGGRRPPSVVAPRPHRAWRHAMGWQPHIHQALLFGNRLLAVSDGYRLEFGLVADVDLILRAGVMRRPVEIDRVTVTYEGGGLSATKGAEIPMAVHRVRVERLQLDGFAERASRAYASFVTARSALGRARRRVSPSRRSTSPGCPPDE